MRRRTGPTRPTATACRPLAVIGCGVLCGAAHRSCCGPTCYSKEHAPSFTDEYWQGRPRSARGAPGRDRRLWRWIARARTTSRLLLMHSSRMAAPSASTGGTYQDQKSFGRTETVEDYYLTRVRRADAVENPIDRQAPDLFGTIAFGGDSPGSAPSSSTARSSTSRSSWMPPEELAGHRGRPTNRWDFFEVKRASATRGISSRSPFWWGVAGLGIGLVSGTILYPAFNSSGCCPRPGRA